jgi:hypothetical protein
MEALYDWAKSAGPWAIGWLVAAYLGNVIIKDRQNMIDAQVKLAVVLETLKELLRDEQNHHPG